MVSQIGIDQPQGSMLSELHDDTEGTPFAGAGAQQFDNVRMVNLLQEGVLGQEVVELLSRVVRLQHLDGYATVAWERFQPVVTVS
jgi:hypothetical protein